MKIILSKYAGFCDGVKRAYEIVENLSKDKKIKKPIFILGSLVHNQDVVKKIEKMGIKKLDFDGNVSRFFASRKGKIGTIIVTAHGIGSDFFEQAKKRNVAIIDTTCPRVTRVQRLAKMFSEKSYQVVITGDKKHKEVKGILEWSGKKAKIIDTIEEAEKIRISPKDRIAIISQTTQDGDLFKKIVSKIKEKYPNSVEIFDTRCSTTQNRQKEAKEIAGNSDVIIIIGSLESNNSKHLWQIARKINPRSYFIERAEDIDKKWLETFRTVGVLAGASTPSWIIQEVCSFIENKL